MNTSDFNQQRVSGVFQISSGFVMNSDVAEFCQNAVKMCLEFNGSADFEEFPLSESIPIFIYDIRWRRLEGFFVIQMPKFFPQNESFDLFKSFARKFKVQQLFGKEYKSYLYRIQFETFYDWVTLGEIKKW